MPFFLNAFHVLHVAEMPVMVRFIAIVPIAIVGLVGDQFSLIVDIDDLRTYFVRLLDKFGDLAGSDLARDELSYQVFLDLGV